MRGHQATGQTSGRGHGNLLAENSADRQLEAIPRARHAQPGPGLDQGSENPILRQMGGDSDGIGRQVKHTAQSRDDGRQRRKPGKLHGRAQRVTVAGLDTDGPLQTVELNGSGVTAGADMLDAGNGALAQKVDHRRPVVGRMIAQRQNDLPLRPGGTIRLASAPQFTRRSAEQRLEGLVETANAAEARRERHLGHRQTRLMNKLLGQQNAAGLRHGNRRRAEMLAEQPPQLPFADAEAACQSIDIGFVQRAKLDQAERARHRVRGAAPSAQIGGRLRAAAQAGAEARLLCRRRGRKEGHILRPAASAPDRPAGNRCRWF